MLAIISALLATGLAVLLVSALSGLVTLALVPSAATVPTTAPRSASAVHRRLRRLPHDGLFAAFALLALALALRALAVGHVPWSNLHEFSIAFATALVGTYLWLARSQPISGLAPLAALLASGLVGVALLTDDRIDPLVPALQQPLLLAVHVGSAALAYAVAAVGFLAAAAELAQRGSGDRIGVLPAAATARAVGHRAVLVAFPILTLAIALGAVWANLAWRSYWSNDPKELAAAATWLIFGAYLHVAGRRDRWERLAPWLIVLGFFGVLFTYLGAGLVFVGEHSYAAP